MTTYGMLPASEMRAIRDKVLYPDGAIPQSTQRGFIYTDEFYAVLDADLAAASNPLTGHTSASVIVLRYADITINLDMEISTTTYTVVNRSESLSGARGTLCLVKFMGAEYIFTWVDCEISATLLGLL